LVRINRQQTFQNKRESAHFNSKEWSGDLLAAGYKGREGLFASMGQGNIFSDSSTTELLLKT
jgi:hypothetical protein